MFRTLRFQLIGSVVAVLAVVLLAVGALVYALLSRQLDGAVDAELRAAAGRVTALAPRLPMPPSEPASGDGETFTIRLVSDRAAVPTRVRRSPSDDGDSHGNGAETNGWHELARTGSVPDDLPDWQAVAAAALGRDDLRSVTEDGQRYRLLTRLYGSEDRALLAVQTGISLEERDRQERFVLLALAGGGALGLALTVAGGVWLTGRALIPVRLAFERQRRFVADASHELRTPLALLRLEAEELAARPDAGLAARPLIRQVDRLGRLVDNLLTLARLDEGALPLEREPVPAAALLATAADEARQLAAPGVTVTVDAPPDLWLSGDPDRLHQVLLILVDNAARATPAGGHIALAAVHEGRAAMLSVTDSGPGIPPEHVQRVFERFYRVDKARSREGGGTGLGLTIARDLVRTHGGEIAIETPPGGGARVCVRLPAVEPPAPGGEE
jgi:signal transduction histidine kinase